jgi:hypothetical protein
MISVFIIYWFADFLHLNNYHFFAGFYDYMSPRRSMSALGKSRPIVQNATWVFAITKVCIFTKKWNIKKILLWTIVILIAYLLISLNKLCCLTFQQYGLLCATFVLNTVLWFIWSVFIMNSFWIKCDATLEKWLLFWSLVSNMYWLIFIIESFSVQEIHVLRLNYLLFRNTIFCQKT